MDQVKKTRNIWKRTGRIVLKTVLFIVLFLLIVVLLIQTAPVQNFLRKKAVAYLEKKLQTKVAVGRIYIGLPKNVVLENIYVEDRGKDTLLSGGKVKANLNLYQLIFKNEVNINSIELENITIKIKRELPDTSFNFQFIVDAFAPKASNNTDTTDGSTIAIHSVEMNKIRVIYKDTISGSDMTGWLEHLDTKIDVFDPEHLHFDVPKTNINGFTAKIYQVKPLARPEPELKDMIEAKQPTAFRLDFKEANLQNIKVDFRNDVSATYSTLNIGTLSVKPNRIDLNNRIIDLQDVSLSNTTAAITLGKKEQTRVVIKEVKQEAKSQVEAGWRIQVANIDLENNNLQYDNDNNPRIKSGMDYAHLKGSAFTLQANDVLLSVDSIAGSIKKASFKEQSGFVLEQLQTDFLYANNQSYLKDLLFKTPGTELKRSARLTYSSYKALAENFSNTQMEADISNSYVQVKDILVFAPQLRSQPAFSNPDATWYLNLQGNGTLQSMHIANLQFQGLKNTQIAASGTLATNNDPNRSGATLTIQKLHTNQTDLALFTGTRLSDAQVNIPEEFNINGTIAGSVNNLSTNLHIVTSAGSANVNGRFTNLSNPNAAGYTALVKTNGLDLGSILRNGQIGNINSSLAVSGKGLTPGNFDAKFKGTVYTIGFNDYAYRNIDVSGKLQKSTYTVIADVHDPNADIDGTLTGTISDNPSFRFEGMIDSLKTLPLHFTTQPVVVRGKIDADVPVMNENYLEANVLITKALIVSSSQRLPLDTIQFISGRNDSASFMSLSSDVANARISGKYRYTELGEIFQKSIEPYFAVTPAATISGVQPYDFSFTADVANAPVLAAFVPGLKTFDPIHIEGSAATNQGLTASMTTKYISYQGNEISGLDLKMNTSDKGLQLAGDVQRMKGLGLDLYHTRLNATALNNKVDFDLAIDDNHARTKYYLGGILTQPSLGNYTLSLGQDSLLLNYESWTISPGNSLTITKDNILANNFELQKGDQKLTLQSQGQQLNADLANFQLSTITAFMRSDSLLANGSMNGKLTFKNILKQPVFTSDLTINDLSFKGDTVGNAVIKVDNSSGDRYNTQATITGRGNDIALTGSFAPQGESDIALNLDLAIRQMQLSTMEGVFGGMLKNASGSVNGTISVRGTVNEPKIDGPVNFDKASFAISILGSQFRVDGEKINVTQNGFHFDDFVIRDTANNELVLNGIVQSSNFINYFFDMDVKATNFKILNTTKKENKIYYGTLVITTALHVDGTESYPIIDGNITVNEGTNLNVVIPQREPGVVEREGIVEFVDMDTPENDTLFKAYDSLNVSSFKGMDITTNIEIKKEAAFTVVIDEANGDFVNMQGEALLSTGIDPSGKITLVGNYELEKGSYDITFNFLHRRFDIQKGSKIVWLNEPTKATMDITAVYIANTSPIDLVQNQISASSQAIRNTYLQKLPFEVRLHMTGELLDPKLAFDIVLPDNKNYGVSNDIITQVDSRLEQLRQEPGEIDKQVFALLLLNRFVGQNPLASSTPIFDASSYARQSVSKLLTDQLNKLAAGLIDGVDLTFDVTSSDDYTTGDRRNRTDLNIGLSKRLLNERLTVTVGSNFELEGPKNTNQKPSNVIGNLSVNYNLSKDGRYMLRFYRKNEYEGIVDGYIVESGLSFIISVDYNRISELLRRKKKQRVDGVQYTK
jgi:translocation and assembly module TamB